MNIAQKLSAIQQEIQTVKTEKLQREQMLGLLWEHPLAIDPEIVVRLMQEIRDHIFRSPKGRERCSKKSKHSLCRLSPTGTGETRSICRLFSFKRFKLNVYRSLFSCLVFFFLMEIYSSAYWR